MIVAGLGDIDIPLDHATGLPVADLQQVFPFAEFSHPIDDFLRLLPVLVIPGVGPGIVGGIAGLPQAFLAADGHFHIAKAEIVAHAVADARAEHGIGLLLSNQLGERLDIFDRHTACRKNAPAAQTAAVTGRHLQKPLRRNDPRQRPPVFDKC